ncbi:MAG: NAD(P)-binding domain-containing protein, partial [Pseudomonadota bacterium]
MRIGFIGLGNVGGKLCGTLLRNGWDVTVHDLDPARVDAAVAAGARSADGPGSVTRAIDAVITCLPRPDISAAVLEGDGGVLSQMRAGQLWLEMSTTDAAEVRRLGDRVAAAGGMAVDCPVSGGCHRAATGNISIFAGCTRDAFDTALPILTTMGRRVLHTG